MKGIKKIIRFLSIFIGLFLTQSSQGQVYFGIDYEPSNSEYTISLKSTQTVSSPLNSTGTAQVTIRLESSDSFEVSNLTSLVPNVSWKKTIRVNRPVESASYDYITFGLTSLGTAQINYEKDTIVPLFSFKNTGGVCPNQVEIINNQTDDFLYPNSEKLSIKNHISVLAIGGNAYVGAFKQVAECEEQLSTSTQNLELEGDFKLYPNPATDWLTVAYQLTTGEATELVIYDAVGRHIQTMSLEKSIKQQQVSVNINALSEGVYVLRLRNSTHLSKAISFVKLAK